MLKRTLLIGLACLASVAAPAAATFPGTEGLVAFECSRGNTVAICAADPAGDRVWAMTAPRFDSSTDDADARPAWSADGQWLAYLHYHRPQTLSEEPFYAELRIMRADGSGGRAVLRDERGAVLGPAWSPDGRRIAYVGRDLVVADLTSGTVERHALDQSLRPSGRLSWQPKGELLALTRPQPPCTAGGPPPTSCGSDSEVWTLSSSTGEFRPVTDPQRQSINQFEGADWSPSGDHLLAACPTGICEIGATTGASATFLTGSARAPAYSPDGRRAVVSTGVPSRLELTGRGGPPQPPFVIGDQPTWQARTGPVAEPPDEKALRRARVASARAKRTGRWVRIRITCAAGPGRCAGTAWIAPPSRTRCADASGHERIHPVVLPAGASKRIRMRIPTESLASARARRQARLCVVVDNGGPLPDHRAVIVRP